MRSEKVILLRHLVALLAVSSATSWIQSVQGLKFSPINEITLGTEVTIDWTGQPSLGNVEQSVVLMKDGNALLTLCQGQITGSGQCSFELNEEHQVLGDGYQLAMQGKDGVALDYSAEFSIKAGDVKVESSSGDGEEEVEEKGDEDEVEIEVIEDKDDGEDEDNDKEEQGDGDDDDAKVEKERTGHDDEEDDNDHKEENEDDNNKVNDDDDEDDGGAKKKKDKKKDKKKHGYQKSQVHEQKAKNNKHQQQHHHHNKQQKNKKQPKQRKQKEQQQQQKDGYYKQQVEKLVKTFQQQQKELLQHRFNVMSTGNREQRAKEVARLLEKNRRRRQMLLVARRHQYLGMRQQALGLQASINSIFNQLAPPMAHAAEPPRARVVVSASNDADESSEDSNIGIGIKPVLGNDAHVELMPEDPIQKVATGAVAGGTDEIDMELADEQEHHPDKKDKKDKKEKEKKAEQADAKEKKDAKAETKDEVEPSAWDKILGGIVMFSKNIGATVADGFKKVQQVVIGGGANAPEGEL